MARFELEAPVTLSVLDRLIDTDPKTGAEPPLTRGQSLRQLKASLKRDLEWLLNTRQVPDERADDYTELAQSVYRYGLPDITSLSVRAVQDQARLRRALESAVAAFEPRILGTRVSMDIVPMTARGIRFHIQGLLRVNPSPEPVAFDTMLELPGGQYEVKGD
jgi:type VI secretion system protein ImpF